MLLSLEVEVIAFGPNSGKIFKMEFLDLPNYKRDES